MTVDASEKFVVLAILDGWGIAPKGPGNAITLSETPNMNKFWASYPHTQLQASGEAVGLPRGEDGNTETGHLNLGAGRIVYQELERINMSIADGTFFKNNILLSAIEHAKKNKSNLHLMGLIGAGGVHSNIEHLFALILLAKMNNFNNLFIHLFTDGRDSPPTSAKTYVDKIKQVIKKEGVGKIASIMGRYWAMDRDSRWDRTAKAYLALTKGIGNKVIDTDEAIENSYKKGVTDEFIYPSIICGDSGKPTIKINDNDAIIFFNFRIDRPRQLTKAFILSDFSETSITQDFDPHQDKYHKHPEKQNKINGVQLFERGNPLKNLHFVTMTEYSKLITDSGGHPAFPPEKIESPMGAVLSVNNIRQLRITESEKERFVTFYFNGLKEEPYTSEDRIIIPSPLVPTYDQKPEMSSQEITETIMQKMQDKKYGFILVNYPNADLVGHTGNIGAAVKANEIIDECLGKLSTFILAHEEAVLLITADHGNVEEMINAQTGQIDTEHSTNPVPFIAVSRKYLGNPQTLTSGILADVAPTVLSILGLPIPEVMTGRNLLEELTDKTIVRYST
jgi:2,3-bisphosphoglycerate-independent phosphoglycerate mutase